MCDTVFMAIFEVIFEYEHFYTRDRNDFPSLRGLFDTMRRQVSLTYY